MATRQEEIRAAYTTITGIVSPYSNYLQPDGGIRMLLPYEWVLALVASGIGVYMTAFLKELGKMHAKQVSDFLSQLKETKKPEEKEAAVIDLYCRHIEEVTIVSEAAGSSITNATMTARSELIAYLRSKSFPEDTATRVGAQISDELLRLLDTQSKGGE